MPLVCQQEAPDSTATIAIVTPARLMHDIIRSVLESQGHTVIGDCKSLDQIVSGLDLGSSPDLFVVCGYGSEHSFELSRSIRQSRSRMPAAKWIVIGADADSTLLRAALEAGADGLLFDESPPEVLRLLTSLVLLGHSFIPTPMARILSEHLARAHLGDVPDSDASARWVDEGAVSRLRVGPPRLNSPANHPSRRVSAAPEERVSFNLSRREREILHWLTSAASNKVIAEMCDIPVQKVKHHMRVLFRKLKVSNRHQAAIKALTYPTLPLPPSRN
jgi:DNA-binding NarL/FixJ family response regulator